MNLGLEKRRWLPSPALCCALLYALVVLGCGSGNGPDGQTAQQVDCGDFCSKSSECLAADEAGCFQDCLGGYDDPQIECLRLCDRKADCFLYVLCAGYCILAE